MMSDQVVTQEPSSILTLVDEAIDDEDLSEQIIAVNLLGGRGDGKVSFREHLTHLGILCEKLTETAEDKSDLTKYGNAVKALLNKPIARPLALPKNTIVDNRLVSGKRGFTLHDSASFFAIEAEPSRELMLIKVDPENPFDVDGQEVITGTPLVSDKFVKDLLASDAAVTWAVSDLSFVPSDMARIFDAKGSPGLLTVQLINAAAEYDNKIGFKDNELGITKAFKDMYSAASKAGSGLIIYQRPNSVRQAGYTPLSMYVKNLNSSNVEERMTAEIILFILMSGNITFQRSEDDIAAEPLHYALWYLKLNDIPRIDDIVLNRLKGIFSAMPATELLDSGEGLFFAMDYDSVQSLNDNREVHSIQKALFAGDLYTESRDRIYSSLDTGYIDIAIGTNNMNVENPALVPAGGSLFDKELMMDSSNGSGEDKKTALYKKQTIAVQLVVLAAYGNPKTYADIVHYYAQSPADVKNRTTRFCSRVDSLLRVGINPELIIQTSWDSPGEVINRIVEQRLGKYGPLSYEDLRLLLEGISVN